jgi:hypothetical protein
MWFTEAEGGLENFEAGFIAKGDATLVVLNLNHRNVEPVEDGIDALLELNAAAQYRL